MDTVPLDINDAIGYRGLTPENAEVIFESSQTEQAIEFKDFPREIDESITVPIPLREKTHTWHRKNQHMSRNLTRSYKGLKKYREFK